MKNLNRPTINEEIKLENKKKKLLHFGEVYQKFKIKLVPIFH